MEHHNKERNKNAGYINIPFNGLQVAILSDGYFDIGNPQPVLAQGIPPELVRSELNQLYLPETFYEAPINVMLIRQEGRVILVDTGEGYHDPENAGKLLYSLNAAGFAPGDITDILITHAHRDHIGGILARDGTFIYHNARYHIARPELEFWMAAQPDFSKSKHPEGGKSGAGLIKSILAQIRGRLQVFEPGDELFSCLTTKTAPGHTPGHIVFTVAAGDRSITNLVDVVHSPLLIAQPDWGTQWDVDFDVGIATRNRLLEHCYHNRALVMAAHLPWPGIGYIGKCAGQWQWIPKACNGPFYVRL